MEDGQEGNLRKKCPDKEVDVDEGGEEDEWDEASTEQWPEIWVSEEVVDALAEDGQMSRIWGGVDETTHFQRIEPGGTGQVANHVGVDLGLK